MQWYKWFPGDYQRDTNHLTFIEDAAYRRLLDAYFSSGKLPANIESLLRICRAITPDEQRAVQKIVNEFFETNSSQLIHNKVETMLAQTAEKSQKRSEAGKLGAAVTNSKRSANATANDVAFAENLNGKNSSIPEPDPEKKYLLDIPTKMVMDNKFDTFWAAYPKKVGKAKAKKEFCALKVNIQTLNGILEALSIQCKSNNWTKEKGQYIPYPAKWLKERRWEDDFWLSDVTSDDDLGGGNIL